MTASLPAVFNVQLLTDTGAPASGFRLYTYSPGTTVHKIAYTDAAASVPHTYTNDGAGGQYIQLNARGELPAPFFLTSGAYDLTLKTPAGATVWTRYAVGSADVSMTNDAAIRADLASTVTGKGASLVGYLPSGAGAVGLTVQAKLRDSVSVKDFGAVGDGVTNDAAAIQAAVNASRRVYFPQQAGAFYRCNAPITLRQDTYIEGANKQNTVVKFFGTDGFIADTAGAGTYDIRIEGLSIFGDGTGANKDGLRIDGTAGNFGRVELAHIILSGFTRDGVSLIRPIVSELRLVQSSSNGRHGFYLLGDGTSVNAIGCYAHLNTGDGWRIENNIQYSTLIACASDANTGAGYNINGTIALPAQGISLINCGAESNVSDQFKAAATLGLTLQGIFQFSATGHFINLDGCRNVALIGIRMDTAAPAGKFALNIGNLGGTQFPNNIKNVGSTLSSVNDPYRSYVNMDTVASPLTFLSGVTGAISNGAIVAHNLGVVPTQVLVSTGDSTLVTQADTFTATTFRLLVQDSAGGFPAARSYRWTVIA